jgi:SET domain-containing protein
MAAQRFRWQITSTSIALLQEERDKSVIFSNHSCEPNIGVREQIVFVAMRDIAAGEE